MKSKKISSRLLVLPLAVEVTLQANAQASSEGMGDAPAPEMQKVLDQLAKLDPKPLETLSAVEARKQPSPADAMKNLALKSGDASPRPEPVGDVDDFKIPGADGKIKVRVYTPKGDGPFPVIVYYHGGGWVIADLDTYDASARALTNAVGAVVLSVHYRQAPEHKFPAAHEDAFAAYQWAQANLKKLKGQIGQVAVAGESAGGNLAAAVCLMAREKSATMPVHQLLVYPIADYSFETPSYRENENAKPLGKAAMQWFFAQATQSSDADNPHLSLLRAKSLEGLPPATVITAQIDPLRSEGKAYAEKLQAAGVPTSYRNYEGVTHEFFGMGAQVPQAREAVEFAAQSLRRAFAQESKR